MVRKSDGAIFDYGKFDLDMDQQSWQASLIRPNFFTDKNNSIYYRSYNSQDGRKSIVKLSLKNPDQIIKEDYLPQGQSPADATMDDGGNLIYTQYQSDGFRLKQASGAISIISGNSQLSDDRNFINNYWTGINKKLYVSGKEMGSPLSGLLKPVVAQLLKRFGKMIN